MTFWQPCKNPLLVIHSCNKESAYLSLLFLYFCSGLARIPAQRCPIEFEGDLFPEGGGKGQSRVRPGLVNIQVSWVPTVAPENRKSGGNMTVID